MIDLAPSVVSGRRSRKAASRGSRWHIVLAALASLLVTASAAAQTIADGTLLVASPELTDPNFSRAVVIILGSNDSGAIGVIVNRPTTLSPAKTFPDLAANFTGYDGTLYRGGPVGPTRLLFLVRGLAAATVQGPEVVDKVFLSSDAEALPDIMRLADGVNDLRVFAGHAEWSPGQLEREIAAGAWTTVPGTDELLFAADPGNLWNALIHRGDGVVADAGSAR